MEWPRTTQKCEHCRKFAGGCTWTEVDLETGRVKFIPVPGWTAVESTHRVTEGRYDTTFQIIDCPEFVSDGTEARSRYQVDEKLLARALTLSRAGLGVDKIRRMLGLRPDQMARYCEILETMEEEQDDCNLQSSR